MAKVRIKPSFPLAAIQEAVNSETIPIPKVIQELKEQIEIRESELKLLRGWKEQLETLLETLK